jgi:hypothetical protein
MELGNVPWLLALLTAAWFGWMAWNAARNWILWAVGGAAFGLVASTIVIGLANAASIPFSDHDRHIDHVKWTAAAVIVILVLGWALSSGLHRHHLALWRILWPDSTASENKPSNPPPASRP